MSLNPLLQNVQLSSKIKCKLGYIMMMKVCLKTACVHAMVLLLARKTLFMYNTVVSSCLAILNM